MSEMAVEAPIPAETRRQFLKRQLHRAWTQTEIVSLKVAEKYLRARALRLLAIDAVGALAAFHGIEGYSHRVAFLLLGAGIIFAVERQ